MTGHQISLIHPLSDRWIKALEYLSRPSCGDAVAAEITRLRTLTAKRKEGEFDLELAIGALTEELMIYPFDIVRQVCREWARTHKFFPVLKELIDECERLNLLRQALMKAVRNANLIELRKPQDPEWQPPTDEEKQRVSSVVKQFLREHEVAS